MTHSANEVMMLATKAARGAGAPPAQAAQFGAATVWHLSAGLPPLVLEEALAELPKGPILELPLVLLELAEQAQEGRFEGPLPLAVTPLMRSYIATLPYHAQVDGQGTVIIDLTEPAQRVIPTRINLPVETCQRWCALAARLLVPETKASRQSGAGAGMIDND